MANNVYTAVAANPHNISIYDAVSGGYISSINVTSGQIIGQPIISANTITVTFTEGGVNYMSVYDAQSLNFVRRQTLI
jgi:hypothetical protein